MIECVPNFSEGRNRAVIQALEQAVESTSGAILLDSTSDDDHNRTVLTFAGEAASVAAAAFSTARVSVESIDLRRHTGVHPRLGALDVCPFVPLEGATLPECARIAEEVGERIWDELRVPVYFYEAAARRPECVRLENVRRLAPAGLIPDLGDRSHASAGFCVVGARRFLIAWNIILESFDLEAARAIARQIRESNGGLPAVKALGLALARRSQVQVSINLVDFERTPLYIVFSAVEALCRNRGISIAGSELIGLVPRAALESSQGHDLHWLNMRPELVLEDRLRAKLAK